MDFTAESVLLNNFEGGPPALNALGLAVKHYIYRQRCVKKNLVFNELKTILTNMQNMEKYIAIKNDKLTVHIKKWSH